MKSKKIMSSILALAAIALVGCKSGTSVKSNKVSQESDVGVNDTTNNVTLNMSVYYDNDDRHMKFISGAAAKLPYNGCGGLFDVNGFKPVWKELQEKLNFTINDLSPTGKVSIKDNFTTLVSSGFKNNQIQVDIAQGNSDQILTEGSNGTILDLAAYLNQMPNFKKFLEDNPAVWNIIQNDEGNIYYAPYFDGFDDIERMMMLRKDYVEKLLDGDLPTDEGTAVGTHYTPFYTSDVKSSVNVLKSDTSSDTKTINKNVPADKNIIKQFNAQTNLTGKKAVELLRNYIDDVYGNTYTKRSQLFVGGQAVYDVDELVALFKCVQANAKFLTGKDDVTISPLFPRQSTSDRTSDLYRFLQFFGLRGVESRNNYFYVGPDGNLVDVRGTEGFKNGIKKLHEMYEDNLIFKDFDEKYNNSTDFRGPLLTCASDAKIYGFATYDYNQTTTVYNDTTNDTSLEFVSVLPAVADYDDGTAGNYIHYTESWRSVKTQGWFITSETKNDKAKLARALKLFDYLYSDEGNRIMSYGPDAYLAKNADGSIKTMEYQGKQVPVLSDACKKEMKDLCGGNYTNYYRYYLGATLPVGYVKEQGMEYQTVSTKAQPSLNMLNYAITSGVLEHVNHKMDNKNHMQDIIPTTFPLTTADNTTLSKDFTDLNNAFTSDKNKVMTISKVVKGGFGTYDDIDLSEANFVNTMKTTLKVDSFTTIYQDAYETYLSRNI